MVASDTELNADLPSKPSGIDLYVKKLYETDITYWFSSYISYNNDGFHDFLAKVHHPTIVYKAGTKKNDEGSRSSSKSSLCKALKALSIHLF